MEAIVDEGRRTGGELLILGAGGSSMALTLYLHTRARAGRDVPARVVVTALDGNGFADIHEVHRRIGVAFPIDYAVTPEPMAADRLLTRLPQASMIVNATGLGKDRPGSPLTDASLPAQRGSVGIQLSRKPRIPRTGEGGAVAPTFARRGWLDLLHPRLDERHRRGVRHRYSGLRPFVRTVESDRP